MKKRLFAGLMAAVLICSIGVMNVFAADGAKERPPGGFGGKHGLSFKKDFSDEEKAQMEATRAQHKEKMESFVNSLTSEQKALYDAMTPERPAMVEGSVPPERPQKADRSADGQRHHKFDEAAMTAMKEKREAFIASLTDEQKTAYDELVKPIGRGFKEKKD